MKPLPPAHTLALLGVLTGCGSQTVDPSALLDAAEQGDLTRLNQLIAASNEVNVRDACRWTPLMKAALNGQLSAGERLLAAGAQPDLRDKGGYTALLLAASNNHADLVRLLLAHGADPNHQESTHGWTALIWAAKRGHRESVRLLLEYGADPDLRGQDGKDALAWATEKKQLPVIALLREHNPSRSSG